MTNTQSRNTKSQQGFTLVEILLYVMIFSIVLSSVTGLYSAIYTFRLRNQAITEVEQQGQLIMQAITQNIRNGSSITSPAVGATATSLTVASYTSGLNPTVFNLSSGVVNMTEGTAAAVPLNSSRLTVSNLSFQNLARSGTNGIIRVTFTVTYVNPNSKIELKAVRNFYGSAALRGAYP